MGLAAASRKCQVSKEQDPSSKPAPHSVSFIIDFRVVNQNGLLHRLLHLQKVPSFVFNTT